MTESKLPTELNKAALALALDINWGLFLALDRKLGVTPETTDPTLSLELMREVVAGIPHSKYEKALS